jgi:glucose-6-phosphate dehydrogenase assembly protein OpcA
MIDLMAIRQAYERREIAEVIWIKGDQNPADSMTKHNGNKALQRIIDSNNLHIEAAGWVERDIDV